MDTNDNPECSYEWFHFECIDLLDLNISGSWFGQEYIVIGRASIISLTDADSG